MTREGKGWGRWLGAVLVLALAHPVASRADFLSEVDVHVDGSGDGGVAFPPQGAVSPDEHVISQSSLDQGTQASNIGGTFVAGTSLSASAQAVASPGGIHLNAVSQLGGAADFGYRVTDNGHASAHARGFDNFVLQVPGVADGTLLELEAAFTLHGGEQSGILVGGNGDTNAIFAGYNARATWDVTASISGAATSSITLSMDCVSSNLVDRHCFGPDVPFGEFSTKVLVMANKLMAVSLEGHASVDTFLRTASGLTPFFGSAEASVLLGNTFAWGGITALRTQDGQDITDFQAVSTRTGFDYRHAYVEPVPLPASWGLLGSGVLLLGAVRRVRPRARAATWFTPRRGRRPHRSGEWRLAICSGVCPCRRVPNPFDSRYPTLPSPTCARASH